MDENDADAEIMGAFSHYVGSRALVGRGVGAANTIIGSRASRFYKTVEGGGGGVKEI